MAHPFDEDPILVEVVRNGFVESVHRGRVVVTGSSGEVVSSVGAASALMYPRSSAKPLQAVGMLRRGLALPDRLLAVVTASHSGEPFHCAGVQEILSMSQLDETALQNPPGWPLDEVAKEAAIRSGTGPTALAMNCSGKHAGMLATTVLNGWDPTTYGDPAHPLQMSLRDTIDELAGERTVDPAVDGCGAPLFGITLVGLARAFGRIAAGADLHSRQLADAVRSHPEWASGSRREEAALHRAIPGLFCKAGAEGVHAAGLPDGRGIAVKISDGSQRARDVAMAGVLQRLGFGHHTLEVQAALPVLGNGQRVGEVRPYRATLSLIGS
ncbi:MAG TPA: asparaginase [Propionibacteriaceae bacterium]|nr:asparaginase [Propionibacteriaceae bacterium]